MLRPPSLQKRYDLFWSRDPAFVQPAADADAKDLAKHEDRVQLARETGNWSGLLVEGGVPTKFIMRPLPGHVWRHLADKVRAGAIGQVSAAAAYFRAALVGIENFGDDLKVTTCNAFGLESIADNAIPDALDEYDITILLELGGEVARRAQTTAPKS